MPDATETPRLRISDRFADVTLINQFRQPVRFRREILNGRAVILNTMYTVCRGSCPGTSAKLMELRDELAPVFGRSLVMASISIDPLNDSPAALLDYAGGYGADRPREDRCDWHFLTGSAVDIDALRRSLGFFDLDPAVDRDPSRHAALLLFGNPRADRWAALPSALRTPLLTEAIRRACGTTFEQRYGIPG